ncbi:hypothetical protein Tco_0138419 [Tanacetum coccineum]
MIEELVKKLSKKDQLKLYEEIALKLQAEINDEERIASAEEEKIDESNIAWDEIQAKVDVDYQLAKRLQAEEQEQFTIEGKATLFKELLEKRRKHFNMEGWKHKDFKSKDFDSIKELFDKALKRVNMFVDFRTELVEGSSKRSGIELEQEVTKKQKVDEIQETTEKIHTEGNKSYYQIIKVDGKSQMYRVFSQMLKSFHRQTLEDLYKLIKAKYESTRPVKDLDLVLWNDLKIYMLVEKKYPLAPFTLSQMLEKKLQIDYEIAGDLIDINAAQSKLVLLENFNENYSKSLRLLVEVTTASTKLLLLEEVTTARGSYYC